MTAKSNIFLKMIIKYNEKDTFREFLYMVSVGHYHFVQGALTNQFLHT